MSRDMTSTLIVECSRCGGFLLAKVNQKTRSCPLCGARIDVKKAKTLGSAETAYDASVLLRKLKLDAAARRSNVRYESDL